MNLATFHQNDQNKKWTPVDKQAALIVRKVSESNLHTAPPKLTPTFAPTQQERVEQYCQTLRNKIEAAKAWKASQPSRQERRKIQRELNIIAGRKRLAELKAKIPLAPSGKVR